MSFCATEPPPKRNLRPMNKTSKALPQPCLYGPPARNPSMPKLSLSELTVRVKKIESLAKLLIICTTALFQLMVAAG